MNKEKVVCTTVVAALFIAGSCFSALEALAQTSSRRNLIFVGTVREDVGRLYRFVGSSATFNGNARWDTCPQGTNLIGRDFQSNGFWLCASPDIANSGTFYFGNVVRDRGFYWEISGGRAMAAGEARWDTCWEGRLRGRLFQSNGFWICQP
ncbi:hypothetical protein [Prochlorothrix hollandica]|uniref:hypothetical protein n=1 Tax=Prochlorothrix hollandica TaxID=1223 RepID=UPI0011D2B071|nr:hypothetical protein [Prochlorothrix hollandica]